MRNSIIIVLAWAGAAGAALAQDLDAGQAWLRKCSPCHAVGEDAQNKIGPALNGLDGRKSGTVEGL